MQEKLAYHALAIFGATAFHRPNDFFVAAKPLAHVIVLKWMRETASLGMGRYPGKGKCE